MAKLWLSLQSVRLGHEACKARVHRPAILSSYPAINADAPVDCDIRKSLANSVVKLLLLLFQNQSRLPSCSQAYRSRRTLWQRQDQKDTQLDDINVQLNSKYSLDRKGWQGKGYSLYPLAPGWQPGGKHTGVGRTPPCWTSRWPGKGQQRKSPMISLHCTRSWPRLVSVLIASHGMGCIFWTAMWTQLGASALTIMRRVSTAEQPFCCSISLRGIRA